MSLETYTKLIRERIGEDNGVVDKKIKIQFKDTDEFIFIDASSKPNVVHNEDGDADLTLVLNTQQFEQLMTKQVAGALLMFSGKLKVKGDVRLAMKMDDILKINKLPPAQF